MKLVPNKLLKNLKADEIQTLDEISFILDHASPTYLKLLIPLTFGNILANLASHLVFLQS